MTQRNIIEIIKQHHPDLPDNQIRIMLNTGMKEFGRKTRILKDTATFNTVVDTRYYEISSIDSTIDGEVSEIHRVDYNGYEIPRLVSAPEKTDIT